MTSESQVTDKTRDSNWTKDQTIELINLVTSSEWTEKFKKGRKSHTVVWSELVQLLSKKCDEKCARNKWDGLKREYRNIKKSLKTGEATPTWPFWEKMKRYMEPRPMENNELVMDSISFAMNESSNDNESFPEPSPSSATDTQEEDSESTPGSSNNTKSQKTPRLSRKRKGEDFESSFKKFLEAQQVDAEENRRMNSQVITLLGTLVNCLQNQNPAPVFVIENQGASDSN